MDFVNKLTGGNQNQNTANNQQQPVEGQKEEGGFLSGLGNKVNAAAGGGKESEKNEDYLDKGMSVFLSTERLQLHDTARHSFNQTHFYKKALLAVNRQLTKLD